MKLVFIILFLSFGVWFATFILKMLRAQISRVFTQNYKELKQIYSSPLYTWGGLTGYLSNKGARPFKFTRTLTLDVYPDMLIVSAMGQGLCLRYDQWIFKQKQELFGLYLVIENLPIQGKSNCNGFYGPMDFNQLTTLQVCLSAQKIDIIVKLSQNKAFYPTSNC